jgi:Flp pilus assembly protein TadD
MNRCFCLFLVFCFNFGCAGTTGSSESPHVLSGEAPVESVIAKADESFQKGDFQAAVILYQIAISQEPTAESWFKLGSSQTYLNEQDRAIHAYYNALELDPEHVGSLERLGLYFTAKGEVARAEEFLQRLVAVSPESWKGYNGLGVLADLEGDFDSAREHYTTALKLRPDIALLWNNLGYSIYLLGHLDKAPTYFQRALELDPDDEGARLNLALVHVREERYEEALGLFLEAEDESTAYTQVGYLAYKVGDYEEATGLLQEAIKRSPTFNRQAHSYLAAAREAIRRSG